MQPCKSNIAIYYLLIRHVDVVYTPYRLYILSFTRLILYALYCLHASLFIRLVIYTLRSLYGIEDEDDINRQLTSRGERARRRQEARNAALQVEYNYLLSAYTLRERCLYASLFIHSIVHAPYCSHALFFICLVLYTPCSLYASFFTRLVLYTQC